LHAFQDLDNSLSQELLNERREDSYTITRAENINRTINFLIRAIQSKRV